MDLIIIAAEPSADLLGDGLIRDLLRLNPDLKIGAVAGPLMRKLPIEVISSMEKLCSMGFIGILSSLPRLFVQFFKIRKAILKRNPKAAVFIDYPGFNLRLERSLRKKGFQGKIIHYVCPTVWAWGKKRIPLLEKNVDLLLCLFPFEKSCFSGKKLQVEYVGHPLKRIIKPSLKKRTHTLALFPGSRFSEIEKNLPKQIAAAKKLQKEDPSIEVAVSISQPNKEELIKNLTKDFPCKLVLPSEAYSLMRSARLALATSGTVTLELALHGTPTVVNYAIRKLDLFLAQKIFRINLPFYCIVNIIANKEIFPEFFGPNLTVDNLTKAAKALWNTPQEVPTILDKKDASVGAALLIQKFFTNNCF